MPIDSDAVGKTPVVKFYWPGRAVSRYSGQTDLPNAHDSLDDDRLNTLLSAFIAKYESFMASVDIGDPSVAFPFGDSLCDRLEAVVGKTEFVDIPLVRTNATSKTASNVLTFSSVGGEVDVKVSWAAGESRKFVRYDLPNGIKAGETVAIALKGSGGAVVATRHITLLASVENSPKNPYWIGEKDTLDWGEWSMDLDAVTNTVKAYNDSHSDRAYAMMFVGGSTWCPDCAMAEENFFSNTQFKQWAINHKVIFGVLDIPNNPQAADDAAWPSQLRYESSRASDAFVTLRGTAPTNELQRYQSGAGYLSRHSVPYEMATNVAARNAFLMGHDTLNGGWNRPERSNKNRTGVPVLILLRGDGTIAARWNRFSDVGPAAYADGYLRRFEEMLAQVDAPDEETNDDKSTTQAIVSGTGVSGSVSSVDQADVYAIQGVSENEVVTLGVQGGMAEVKVSVLDAAGFELTSASGIAASGFSVTNKFRTAGSYFVKVSPKSVVDGTFFGYTNEVSTVCGYSLAASSWMSCGEFGFTAAMTNVNEDCDAVVLSVSRSNGSAGAASVQVSLVEALGEGVNERISWSDQTIPWAAGETGVKMAHVAILPDGKKLGDMRLRFRLSDATTAGRLELTETEMVVNVYDVDYDGKPAYRYVAATDIRPVTGYQEGDAVECRLVRGMLPDGVDVYAEGGEVGAMGYATAPAGTYSAVYAITVTRGGQAVSCEEMSFKFEVIDYDFAGDIPSVATVRTYGNRPVDPDETLLGLLTVTVPPDGRLSAKYLTAGKAFAYAADGWSSYDRLTGTLTAVLEMTTDTSKTMEIVFDAQKGLVTFDDPVAEVERQVTLVPDLWPAGSAAPWKGQYTVQMPQTNVTDQLPRLGGSAYMALRMVSDEAIRVGSILYAGVLPNGRAVFGSAQLSTNQFGQALVPFCHVSEMISAPYSFSGEFAIERDAETNKDNADLRWCVTAAVTPVWEVPDIYRHKSEFNVYGSYYDFETIATRFAEDVERLDNLAFFASASTIQSGRYGAGLEIEPVAAEMTETNMPALVTDMSNPQRVSLSFSVMTGVVRGSFEMPFENRQIGVVYRGIALPGWQGCSTCSARNLVLRPWACGACSFSDRSESFDPFRNGCEIKLDQR